MKTAIITQARMSSTRLPGKVMLKIKDKTLLEYHITRLQSLHILIIVATSTDEKDDEIVKLCKTLTIPVFRGERDNVLTRYFYCSQKFNLDTIIRVTSDCPLIDGELISRGLRVFKKSRCDYLSNTFKRTFPRGFDFEIFTYQALSKACRQATKDYEKEHVTPYIWQNTRKEFTIQAFTQEKNTSNYRITLDTHEDFIVIKELIQKYRAHTKNVDEIIEILDTHPEIVRINAI